MTDRIKCLSCGYDVQEEKCSHEIITPVTNTAAYIIVRCGRNGTVLYKEVRTL